MGCEGVKKVLLVLSGKGGVGKSSVAVQLAVTLALSGLKVGLLDIDLCGPSIPKILKTDGARITQGPNGWIPILVNGSNNDEVIKVMSIAFLLPNKDDAVVWRGPKKTALIKQFIGNVDWGDLDYLVVDTPPGTSDEHIAITEALHSSISQKSIESIIVTTPQLVAIADVEREIGFCQTVGLSVVGIIENMSGYSCPHCSECTNVFSSEGGRLLAEKYSLPFLGKIPIYPPLIRLMDSESENFITSWPHIAPSIHSIFKSILNQIIKKEE